MAATNKVRIGFISASGATSPHFEGFRALIPDDVEFDFEGLGLDRESLYVAEVRGQATITGDIVSPTMLGAEAEILRGGDP